MSDSVAGGKSVVLGGRVAAGAVDAFGCAQHRGIEGRRIKSQLTAAACGIELAQRILEDMAERVRGVLGHVEALVAAGTGEEGPPQETLVPARSATRIGSMSADRPADSFGTFLEIVQGKRQAKPGDQGDAALTILATLDRLGPTTVWQLWPETKLDLTTFAGALTNLRDGGLIESSGSGDAEVLELTRSGRTVASLQRSSG